MEHIMLRIHMVCVCVRLLHARCSLHANTYSDSNQFVFMHKHYGCWWILLPHAIMFWNFFKHVQATIISLRKKIELFHPSIFLKHEFCLYISYEMMVFVIFFFWSSCLPFHHELLILSLWISSVVKSFALVHLCTLRTCIIVIQMHFFYLCHQNSNSFACFFFVVVFRVLYIWEMFISI